MGELFEVRIHDVDDDQLEVARLSDVANVYAQGGALVVVYVDSTMDFIPFDQIGRVRVTKVD